MDSPGRILRSYDDNEKSSLRDGDCCHESPHADRTVERTVGKVGTEVKLYE